MTFDGGFLTYCTNIHPGNDWDSHKTELELHVPVIKQKVSPDEPMGLGLRVSYEMLQDLKQNHILQEFKEWLSEEQVFVFLINGFPYGQFHRTVIKDKVHDPDWTTAERLEYSRDLCTLLSKLLPENIAEGGVSTPPLSYRHWYPSHSNKETVKHIATRNMVQMLEYLVELHDQTGKIIHLDVEPEPDGLLENGAEFIQWYKEMLLPTAVNTLSNKGINEEYASAITRRHIRLCYDVCHIAVGFEDQHTLIKELNTQRIPIGRVQLSSALRLPAENHPSLLKPFDESQYLHQVVVRSNDGSLVKFPDLPVALESREYDDMEWRIHFHVPLFTKNYGGLDSTQDEVIEILQIHQQKSVSRNFEIETYTWEVLPQDLQRPIKDSIAREFEFILDLV